MFRHVYRSTHFKLDEVISLLHVVGKFIDLHSSLDGNLGALNARRTFLNAVNDYICYNLKAEDLLETLKKIKGLDKISTDMLDITCETLKTFQTEQTIYNVIQQLQDNGVTEEHVSDYILISLFPRYFLHPSPRLPSPSLCIFKVFGGIQLHAIAEKGFEALSLGRDKNGFASALREAVSVSSLSAAIGLSDEDNLDVILEKLSKLPLASTSTADWFKGFKANVYSFYQKHDKSVKEIIAENPGLKRKILDCISEGERITKKLRILLNEGNVTEKYELI